MFVTLRFSACQWMLIRLIICILLRRYIYISSSLLDKLLLCFLFQNTAVSHVILATELERQCEEWSCHDMVWYVLNLLTIITCTSKCPWNCLMSSISSGVVCIRRRFISHRDFGANNSQFFIVQSCLSQGISAGWPRKSFHVPKPDMGSSCAKMSQRWDQWQCKQPNR